MVASYMSNTTALVLSSVRMHRLHSDHEPRTQTALYILDVTNILAVAPDSMSLSIELVGY